VVRSVVFASPEFDGIVDVGRDEDEFRADTDISAKRSSSEGLGLLSRMPSAVFTVFVEFAFNATLAAVEVATIPVVHRGA